MTGLPAIFFFDIQISVLWRYTVNGSDSDDPHETKH